MVPDYQLLPPADINLYRRKVLPLYPWLMWPAHTNTCVLYLRPWTSVESSGVYLVTECKTESCIQHDLAGHPVWWGSPWTDAGHCLAEVLRGQAYREQEAICLFVIPTWSSCSWLATDYRTQDKTMTPSTILQLQVGHFRLLYITWNI